MPSPRRKTRSRRAPCQRPRISMATPSPTARAATRRTARWSSTPTALTPIRQRRITTAPRVLPTRSATAKAAAIPTWSPLPLARSTMHRPPPAPRSPPPKIRPSPAACRPPPISMVTPSPTPRPPILRMARWWSMPTAPTPIRRWPTTTAPTALPTSSATAMAAAIRTPWRSWSVPSTMRRWQVMMPSPRRKTPSRPAPCQPPPISMAIPSPMARAATRPTAPWWSMPTAPTPIRRWPTTTALTASPTPSATAMAAAIRTRWRSPSVPSTMRRWQVMMPSPRRKTPSRPAPCQPPPISMAMPLPTARRPILPMARWWSTLMVATGTRRRTTTMAPTASPIPSMMAKVAATPTRWRSRSRRSTMHRSAVAQALAPAKTPSRPAPCRWQATPMAIRSLTARAVTLCTAR